jgi:protein phosphatase
MFKRLPEETGPFDIIGDIHGCGDELEALLQQLGYRAEVTQPGLGLSAGPVYRHPENRKAIFLGDLVDRGPRILDTLRMVYNMVGADSALCVIGNHDDKLLRKLKGRNVQLKHGLETTMAEIEALPDDVRDRFEAELVRFLEWLPNHYILDQDRLVVAHAGLIEELHGQAGGHAKAFALYGETTGEKDEYGLPVRGNWMARYRGEALVVYGHTPVPEAQWQNNTVNVDTGCVLGGRLSALRYPEREVAAVRAKQIYYQSAKPFPRAS